MEDGMMLLNAGCFSLIPFYKFVKLENIAVPITVEPRNCNGTTGDEDKRWNTNLIAKTVLVNHLTACAKGGNAIVKVSHLLPS